MTTPRTRHLKIVAQDPSIKGLDGRILTASISIPAEEIAPGPSGYRVRVIDYDSSTGTHYMPLNYPPLKNESFTDPFEKVKTDKDILEDPNFHAQNVYAIIMRTLARFEFALGRRISWGFAGHQINVAPHAFADANAFYSERDRALMFGYFRSPANNNEVFSCLSHDVVAHETTHAILDGLRKRYTTPSSPEQAGFHEGFADIVALLSVFSLRDIVRFLLLDSQNAENKSAASENPSASANADLIHSDRLQKTELKKSVLFGLAKEMGQEMSGVRGRALRRSVSLEPLSKDAIPYLDQPAFEEPHRCGELLVAALLNAFIEVWDQRIAKLKKQNTGSSYLNLELVVEQGAEAAEHLLTMAIRALDYTPPTDIKFSDYLSALLTADKETVPDDSKYSYRQQITQSFRSYGIEPASPEIDGAWQQEEEDDFKYDRTHFESLLRDPTEVFRFIWDNREKLKINDLAYTKVQSVRPCLRITPDGFAMRETVAEYVQMTTVRADELQQLFPPIGKPVRMPKDLEVTLYGGGTLIFDDYGRIKYHIANRLLNQSLQAKRIDYLWRYGYLPEGGKNENLFARMHLGRSAIFSNHFVEEEF